MREKKPLSEAVDLMNLIAISSRRISILMSSNRIWNDYYGVNKDKAEIIAKMKELRRDTIRLERMLGWEQVNKYTEVIKKEE
jgi:hypothetical protein